ncbi:MAG: glutamine amidotransferase [Campylobacteraceae bacterium]|jgi:GMP synthase (glutamine-hydrolysing)|nr:glutamine amidotransferase [Campylobacteraceae bacterium]
MFIILKMGDTMQKCAKKYGDFEDWTLKAADINSKNAQIIDPRKENFPDFEDIQGIIITGSHDMVTDRLDWIEKSSEWLKKAAKNSVPIFGICFGHQLLAQTFDGVVANHPEGPEIGTVSVNLADEAVNDPIFKDLPQTFLAHATHTQSVLKLPKNAVLLASNCYEGCHAFRIGGNIWGVQFHPEHDTNIIKEYIMAQTENIKSLSIVLGNICQTPYAKSLIEKFINFCKNED